LNNTDSRFRLSRLIAKCVDCARFFAARRTHVQKPEEHGTWLPFSTGTHLWCVFQQWPARAGLGITLGGEECSCSISVSDPGAPRTSQRPKLLAVIEGLKTQHQASRVIPYIYIVITYIIKRVLIESVKGVSSLRMAELRYNTFQIVFLLRMLKPGGHIWEAWSDFTLKWNWPSGGPR